MQLRHGLRVLRRGRDSTQIGLDPRWALVLDGITPAEHELLTAWEADDSGVGVRRLPHAVPPRRRRELAERLRRAGLLVAADPAAPVLPRTVRHPADPLWPETDLWSLLRHDGRGALHLRARSRAVVGLVGAGRTALAAATCLAASGVGTLLVHDRRPVTTGDVGVCGFLPEHVGVPREEAVRTVLAGSVPGCRVGSEPDRWPDVTVIVSHDAVDPVLPVRLLSADLVHLAVVLAEAGASVGPLVRPGEGPCLRCVEAWRCEADPWWAALSSQVARPPEARHGRQGPRGEPPVLACLAGSLAAGQVLAELDRVVGLDGHETAPMTLGATLEISAPELVPRLRRWDRHPACGCGAPGGPAA